MKLLGVLTALMLLLGLYGCSGGGDMKPDDSIASELKASQQAGIQGSGKKSTGMPKANDAKSGEPASNNASK